MNRILVVLTIILFLLIIACYKVSRGDIYRVTAYCACKKCCGEQAKGITATGKKVRYGMIAVDKKVIPFHSQVKIKGLGIFIAEDTGSAIKGKRIDVYMLQHKEAIRFGVKYLKVKKI